MIRLLLACFLAMSLLSACGWNGTPTRSNDFTQLTSIEIVADATTIAARTSTGLTIKGNYSNLYTRDITDQAVWSSASPAIAEFVSTGRPNRVTGHIPGSAVLTASVGNVKASITLTVSPATITALKLSPPLSTIAKGLKSQFTASGVFSDGTSQDLTADVTWLSSSPDVVLIGTAADNKGLAQAIAVGTSTISAAFDGLSGSTLLVVTGAALQSVTVTPSNPALLTLSAVNFKAAGTYSDGTTADITALADWSSSRSDIATISSGGTTKTLQQGTTTISATLAGVSGASNLKVTGGNLSAITITPALPRLLKGTSGSLTATGSFSNGTSRDISGIVSWSVADSTVATITTPGGNQVLLNSLAVTPATKISAAFGSVSADINLTVTAPQLQSVVISPTSLDLTAGTSSRFILRATFNDGTTQDVSTNADWKSTIDSVATVGTSGIATGRVSGIATGSTAISATYGSQTATATVSVKVRTLQSLTISGTTTANPGNQLKFTATAIYSDGISKDVTEDTAWSLDTTTVAIMADSLSQPGQIVMVDSGTAILTAQFGGKTQTASLIVP